MGIAKVTTAVTTVAGGIGLGVEIGLAIAEAPVAPTRFSQLVSVDSGIGRGWDGEVGSLGGKVAAGTCADLVGTKKFIEVAKKHSDDMIITRAVLLKIVEDPEIKPVVDKASLENVG